MSSLLINNVNPASIAAVKWVQMGVVISSTVQHRLPERAALNVSNDIQTIDTIVVQY